MKLLKMKTVTMALTLIFSITTIASGIALAQGWNGPRKGMGGGGYGYSQQGSRGGSGYSQQGPIMRTEMFNARISVLAEMSDQSEDAIKAKLRYKPMWAVLDEYKIDYEAFNKKMIEKRAEVIKQALSDGKITKDHADFMLERNEDGMGRGGFGPGMRQGRRGQAGQKGQRGGWGYRGQNCPRW